MEEMEHYGVTLHSVKEVIDDTPMGKFARMVLAFVAEMEREKIMDWTITGKMNKARAGKVVSGIKPLYGWKWHNPGEKDYLVLDEDLRATEAAIADWKAKVENRDHISGSRWLIRRRSFQR